MFRTRDFVLLFSAILFLLMAIGTTLINQAQFDVAMYQFVDQSESDETQYKAVVSSVAGLTRDERIADMRAKLASQTVIAQSEEPQIEVEPEPTATTTDEVIPETTVVQCASYRPYGGYWDARSLTLVEQNGQRSLVRGDVSQATMTETVLSLPVRFEPSGNPTCLGSDVIGIANDGSLIRNDEVALYSIFGSRTQIGYALDGLPMYGMSTAALDACGGRRESGQYRYEVRAGSESLINCFAAAPVLLP